MTRVKNKLKKIRAMSFDELRVRSAQAWSAYSERRGWSRSSKLMSDKQFFNWFTVENKTFRTAAESLDHFRQRKSPRFFPAFADKEATTNAFRLGWPGAVKEIEERANRIVQGSFDLLGYKQLDFGNPIDWHLEPVVGKRASLVHWSQLNYLDAQLVGDKKIIWELNRHQYFATLGQAYWVTSDERFAKTFVSHITSWMDQNPPKLGINWASSLEVAFRSISWIWALHFFKDSNELSPETLMAITKFLYLNAIHLERYLSTYFSPNTHLTGEALGLFYLGTLFPEFKESARWRKAGLNILTEQLDRHVQADGVYFEQSSYYHRYTTDFYIHLYILLKANDELVPPNVEEKLRQLLDHLMYITRPDGTSPMFGDDDGGRLLKLDDRSANDFRSTLSTAAAIFERCDYKFVANGTAEETLWLLGADSIRKLDQLASCEPTFQSKGFENSGYYIMRDGWTPDSNYLFFDCGHHGTDNCGHAHADALSFELAVSGLTLLVDPGTFTYTASQDLRDFFRSSAAHNTVTIDGRSWSTPAGPFSWNSIAQNRCSRWITKDRFDYIRATEASTDTSARHQREIIFLKKNYWIIRDYLVSDSASEIKSWLHFDSNVEPLREKDHAIRVMGENGHRIVLQVSTFGSQGDWIWESGWVSHSYGSKVEAPVLSFAVQTEGQEELITFLVPEHVGVGKPVVREIEALNGQAFEVNYGGKHDVLLFNSTLGGTSTGNVETPRFISDFEIAWFRFDSEMSRSPEELLLIGGRTIELDGRVLLNSERIIDYVTGFNVGDRFRLESNQGVFETPLPIVDLESLLQKLNLYSTD